MDKLGLRLIPKLLIGLILISLVPCLPRLGYLLMRLNILQDRRSQLGNSVDGLKLDVEGIEPKIENLEAGDFE